MSVLNFEFSKSIPGLRAFTSLRGHNLGLNTEAPAASVIEAREELWASEELSLRDAIFMRQIHGDHCVEVGAAQRGAGAFSLETAIPDCDLMVSRDEGLMLCVGHADCLAVLMADRKHKSVGVAHMGWRGAALGVAKTLCLAMGSDPADLQVGLSVCLGPCHLELSDEQYQIFSKQDRFEAYCSPLKKGHFFLNLWSAARAQLGALGISEAQIEVQELCTTCHLDQFYSYRAESGKTGRMMSCIGFIG
jgi:YfiH family protein